MKFCFYVSSGSSSVRTAASLALAKCPGLDPEVCLKMILDLYDEKLEFTPPVMDGLGRMVQVCNFTEK